MMIEMVMKSITAMTEAVTKISSIVIVEEDSDSNIRMIKLQQ